MMRKPRVLAVDFDGVIHDKAHPLPGRRMGGVLSGAQAALASFIRRGDVVIIFTVMATHPPGKQVVEDWLKYYEIPYTEVTALKPNADHFIDDKAIKHIDWETTLKVLDETN